MQPDDPGDGPGGADIPHPADANVIPISRGRQKRSQRSGEQLDFEIIQRHAVALRVGERIRFCAARGGWLAVVGERLMKDECEKAREEAKSVIAAIAREAGALLDDAIWQVAKRLGTARGIDAVLNVLRSVPGIVFAPDEADRDPYAFACGNGIVDLNAGTPRRRAPAEIFTRASSIPYDPDAKAPRFEKFLAEVQPDLEVRAYIQRFIGYAAVGVVQEHVIGVFWGPGANGKSVFGEIISYVFGDYARPGPPTLIVSNGHSEPHPTDIASCAGARLVIVQETQRGARFDASKVKLLTGGDKLTARFMRQDFFEFTPTHTMLMMSNYKPSADASDYAFWRRVHLVPFSVVIPEDKRDPRLGEALRAEAPGILRWVVDGALEWQRVGLAPPKVIREQTEAYRSSEDVIGQFLDERTVRLPAASVKASVLYGEYKSWCTANGHAAANANDFGAELVGRGLKRVRHASGNVYLGIDRAPVGESEQ